MDDEVIAKLAKIEQWLNDLNHRVERLEHAMYDNGIIAKLKALEEKFKQMSSIQKLILSFTVSTFLGILVMIISVLIRGGP